MGYGIRAAFGAVAVCFLVSSASAGVPEAASTTPQKTPRWESNLSVGRVSTGRLGAVKSVWWFAVPRVIALGLTFDWITDTIPFSLGVALNAPLPLATPFACAGAGAGLNGCGINYYGGGLKVRLGRMIGVVAEYRMYHFSTIVSNFPPVKGKGSASYIGAGITWLY